MRQHFKQLFENFVDWIARGFCKTIGHNPIDEDHYSMTAICARCGRGLKITYDMMYGETYVVGEDED